MVPHIVNQRTAYALLSPYVLLQTHIADFKKSLTRPVCLFCPSWLLTTNISLVTLSKNSHSCPFQENWPILSSIEGWNAPSCVHKPQQTDCSRALSNTWRTAMSAQTPPFTSSHQVEQRCLTPGRVLARKGRVFSSSPLPLKVDLKNKKAGTKNLFEWNRNSLVWW